MPALMPESPDSQPAPVVQRLARQQRANPTPVAATNVTKATRPGRRRPAKKWVGRDGGRGQLHRGRHVRPGRPRAGAAGAGGGRPGIESSTAAATSRTPQLAEAQRLPDGLDEPDGGGGRQGQHPAGEPEPVQDGHQEQDGHGDPRHLGGGERDERQRHGEQRRERGVDPRQALGDVEVLALQEHAAGAAVDVEVDHRRLPRHEAAAGDGDRRDVQAGDQRRQEQEQPPQHRADGQGGALGVDACRVSLRRHARPPGGTRRAVRRSRGRPGTAGTRR